MFNLDDSLADVILQELSVRFAYDQLRYLGGSDFTLLYERDRIPLTLTINPEYLRARFPDGLPLAGRIQKLDDLIDTIESSIRLGIEEHAYAEIQKLEHLVQSTQLALLQDGTIQMLEGETAISTPGWSGYYVHIPSALVGVEFMTGRVRDTLGEGKFLVAQFYRLGSGISIMAKSGY